MSKLTYQRMLDENDSDIHRIKAVYQLRDVAQYISIGDNFFRYVTSTENVYYFKVYAYDCFLFNLQFNHLLVLMLNQKLLSY